MLLCLALLVSKEIRAGDGHWREILTRFSLLLAMAIMVYALITYHWRASAIRNKGSGPYDDRLGKYWNSLAFIKNFLFDIIFYS